MILLTKRKLARVLLVTVVMMGVLAASLFAPMRAAHEEAAELKPALAPAAKKTLAKNISGLADDIGDVASLLNIKKQMCEVELRPEISFTEIAVDIEIYKDGQKQKTNWSVPRFKVEKWDKHPIDRVQVALLAADLDYLPLEGAIKRHHRVEVKMALKGTRGAGSTDVPKELFDFSHVSASGPFPREAGSATEAPLFFIKARSNELTGADTVSEFIEKNSKGDVLIIYLRVRKE